MSEHTEEHLDLCAALAVGSIDARDRQKLAEHLAEGCLECEVALRDFEDSTVLLAASAPARLPSAGLRDRVLQAAAATPPATSNGREGKVVEFPARRAPAPAPRTWMALAAGLAITTLLAGAWALHLNGQVAKLRGTVRSDMDVIAGLNTQLTDAKRWNDVLSSPDARTASLTATPQAQTILRARATYDPRSQRAVFVFDNLQAPAGKVFQLWAILCTQPASLGVIQTDTQGRAVLELEHVGDPNRLAAFAVSLENPGGSPNPNAPSGPVVMMGKVEG